MNTLLFLGNMGTIEIIIGLIIIFFPIWALITIAKQKSEIKALNRIIEMLEKQSGKPRM